jgi:hypothetical protein
MVFGVLAYSNDVRNLEDTNANDNIEDHEDDVE